MILNTENAFAKSCHRYSIQELVSGSYSTAKCGQRLWYL